MTRRKHKKRRISAAERRRRQHQSLHARGGGYWPDGTRFERVKGGFRLDPAK